MRPDTERRNLRGHALALGLATYRVARGGTQEQEAAAAGVACRTWLRWEKGDARAPLGVLAAVARRWGVGLDVLLAEPAVGPDAALRRLVEECGEAQVVAAVRRVLPAL